MKLEPFIQIVIPLLMGGISAYIAKNRGRNPAIWFFIGLFFGLIGVIVLLILPVVKTSRSTFFGIRQEEPYTIEVTAQQAASCSDLEYKKWYWLDSAHTQMGPVTFSELQTGWREGLITSRSFVWTEGMDAWKQVEELPELRFVLEKK